MFQRPVSNRAHFRCKAQPLYLFRVLSSRFVSEALQLPSLITRTAFSLFEAHSKAGARLVREGSTRPAIPQEDPLVDEAWAVMADLKQASLFKSFRFKGH